MRNKNAHKTKIVWDLNIFQPDYYDEANQNTYYLEHEWYIDPYIYKDGNIEQYSEPRELSLEDIKTLELNNRTKWDSDSWYGLEGFLEEYWDTMSDKLKSYLEKLPRYEEDLA